MKNGTSDNLTFWSEEHLASLSVSRENEVEQTTFEDSSCIPIWALWKNINRNGLYGRMSLEFYPAIKDLILQASSLAWKNAGMGGRTGCLTLNISEYPNGRRRVFVIGHIDNRTDIATKVLFEQEEPRIYFEASEDTKKEIAGTLTTGFGARGFDCDAITNNQFVIESYTQGSFAQYKEGVGTLRASGGDFGGGSEAIIKDGYKLRRLTPLECERLQGLPDNYTQIEWRGKPQNECPDSHRYRAIGNSMAVPVMRWIGERIKNIEGTTNANI